MIVVVDQVHKKRVKEFHPGRGVAQLKATRPHRKAIKVSTGKVN